MKTCPKPEDLVLYAAGESTPEAARDLEAHLAACAACARELALIRRGQNALRLLDREPALRPQAMATLRHRLHEAARPRRSTILTIFGWHRWLAAAAAVVVAVACWQVFGPHSGSSPVVLPTATAVGGTDPLEEVAVAVELLNTSFDLPTPSNETEVGAPPTDDTGDDVQLLLEYLSGDGSSSS